MHDRSTTTDRGMNTDRHTSSDRSISELRVIGLDDGALLVSSDEGGRYRIAIDDVLHSTLRRSVSTPSGESKVAPRDIQTHIRAGMSADEVAAITGAPLDYIRKFEGPVLAEREYIIESALNVAVHTPLEADAAGGSTFGAVIRDRLTDLEATGERWASWKEAASGWIVKLGFVANEIEHDARWQYEPKRSALAPLNSEARTLSQQGDMPGGLIPRLRAVIADERAADSSRFDSGAFDVMGRSNDSALEAVPFLRPTESSPEANEAAIKRAPIEVAPSNQTADLLEALRRRRGERETAAWSDLDPSDSGRVEPGRVDQSRTSHPSTGTVRLIDVPLADFDDLSPQDLSPDDQTPTAPQPFASPRTASKKGRATMPSWDEIVFGARSDDDPA